ncbi:MAG: acyltransferase family protein [Erysipelotrichaceae bacterium]|nr:acyltransferase family protein [Erysipelotrichaceae bacterium]
MKKIWIEYIRSYATLAVVFLHISSSLIDNLTYNDLGMTNYIILDICQLLCRWAVPSFIMITGYLILNNEKKINIRKYIFRIFVIILLFGSFYSFLELFFVNREINLTIIIKSLLNTLQGNTWSHMWYLYTLIGLYIVTPVLRIVTKHISDNDLCVYLYILIIGCTVIDTFNYIFGLNLKNYMELSIYVLYYLTGHYISRRDDLLKGKEMYCMIFGITMMLILDIVSINNSQSNLEWLTGLDNIFTYLFSVGLFLLLKKKFQQKTSSNFIDIISKYSLIIYLIHPFYINILYKVLEITPVSFPIYFGIPFMFLIVLILTLISSMILKKMPFIKKFI